VILPVEVIVKLFARIVVAVLIGNCSVPVMTRLSKERPELIA
jgi:hypothetical protein